MVMKSGKTVTIVCPDCRSEIVVDIVTGNILYHTRPGSNKEASGKKSIQELFAEMEEQKRKNAARFEEEKEALKHRKEILEKKFEEIKKHVDTSDNTPPPSPFDYD